MRNIISSISIFGWLDRLPIWSRLSYPKKGAILRAGKAGLSAIIGVILGAVTDGTLLPKGTGGLTIIIVTGLLQGLDKFIREFTIQQETEDAHADIPTTDHVGETNTDATVVAPTEDGDVVETDSTTVEGVPVIPDAVATGEITESVPSEAPLTDDGNPTIFDDPVEDKT